MKIPRFDLHRIDMKIRHVRAPTLIDASPEARKNRQTPRPITHLAFDPFVTTKASGLGMGLSICRTTLEAQGGKLYGFNDASGAAVFKIDRPLALNTAWT